MKSQTIGQEVQTLLNELMQTNGVNGFEFGVTQQIATIPPFEKAIIWFNPSITVIKSIYEGNCKRLELPINETLEGQYLYIKIKI